MVPSARKAEITLVIPNTRGARVRNLLSAANTTTHVGTNAWAVEPSDPVNSPAIGQLSHVAADVTLIFRLQSCPAEPNLFASPSTLGELSRIVYGSIAAVCG
jgi:hypothetical protein